MTQVEAKDLLIKAVKLRKDNCKFWGNLGDSYHYVKGHEVQANQAYQEAIKLTRKEMKENPEDASLISSLALYLAKQGNYDPAFQKINQALKQAPEHLEILRISIMVFELSGKRDRAILSLEEFMNRKGPTPELIKSPFLVSFLSDPRAKTLLNVRTDSH